jgi:hypothetical protein
MHLDLFDDLPLCINERGRILQKIRPQLNAHPGMKNLRWPIDSLNAFGFQNILAACGRLGFPV